jgi:hypothetical protein
MQDGSANEVIKSVLAGRTYSGSPLLSIPIIQRCMNPSGCVWQGCWDALFGAFPQKSMSLRESIFKIVLGKTATYLLFTVLVEKGCLCNIQGGRRDGEVILDAKDADGNYFIRDIIEMAFKSPRIACLMHITRGLKERKHSAKKLAAITYYKPSTGLSAPRLRG